MINSDIFMKTLKPPMLGLAVLTLAVWYVAAAPIVSAVSNVTTGSLTVIKQVINDSGQTKIANDFTLMVTDGSASTTPVTGNASGAIVTMNPGTYGVTEASDPDYTTSYSADCTGTIGIGESKTCTVTNDDIAPPFEATTGTLIVIKNLINAGSDDLLAGDFNLQVAQSNGESTSTQVIAGNPEGAPVTLDAGDFYQVTEPDSLGYAASYSVDCSGTVEAGQTKTCTVTNNNTPGLLTIKKHVINDDGGSSVASDFLILVSYQNGESTSTTGFYGNEEGVDFNIPQGRYFEVRESETTGNGYTKTFPPDCSGRFLPGETKTCAITNDDQLLEDRGKITIIKRVVNRYDGTKTAANFTLSLDYQDAPPWPFNLYPAVVSEVVTSTANFPGDEKGVFYVIKPGYYRVYETDHPGYTVSYSEGCSGTITGGTEKTCTVTNADIEVSHGGPGWSPGILEPFYLGKPPTVDSVTPGGQTQSTGSAGTSTGRVLGIVSPSSSDALLACAITESEARFITSDPADILGLLGKQRDLALESRLNLRLTSRVASDATSQSVLRAIRNFVTYGTPSTLRLGAGERAGAVASFRAAYGRLPADVCDWQDVVRLADTKQPTKSRSRDLAAASTFMTVYGHDLRLGNITEAIAHSLIGYGIRPQARDLAAERKALGAFSKTFGKLPTSTVEWDTNRALAYSGLAQRWLPASMALASSRILSIDGLGTYFGLSR
jgi:hypothetical protein